MARPANGLWQVADDINEPNAWVWFEGTEAECRAFVTDQWGLSYTAWINHRTIVPDED